MDLDPPIYGSSLNELSSNECLCNLCMPFGHAFAGLAPPLPQSEMSCPTCISDTSGGGRAPPPRAHLQTSDTSDQIVVHSLGDYIDKQKLLQAPNLASNCNRDTGAAVKIGPTPLLREPSEPVTARSVGQIDLITPTLTQLASAFGPKPHW